MGVKVVERKGYLIVVGLDRQEDPAITRSLDDKSQKRAAIVGKDFIVASDWNVIARNQARMDAPFWINREQPLREVACQGI